jgi:ABC-2 type transport system ATP-binding protein
VFRQRFGGDSVLVVDLVQPGPPIDVDGAVVDRVEGPRQWLRFSRERVTAAQLINAVTERVRIQDLAISDPEIEDVVRRIYERTSTLGGT